MKVEVYGIKIEGEITPGFDLASAIVQGALKAAGGLRDGDVVVVTSKAVSKAEGRLVALSDVQPSSFASSASKIVGKPPEVVELALREARRVVRMSKGLLITEDVRGWVSANSGVDVSNMPPGYAALLPLNPDGSARRLRDELARLTGRKVAVIISDTQGRPLRKGQVDVAIGVAGIKPLRNRRGEPDLYGYRLRVKEVAVADELASAAELVIGQAAEAVPAAIIRGAVYEAGEDVSANELQRSEDEDVFL